MTEPSTHYENPFCAARLRPGVLPYLFPAGSSQETLLTRLGPWPWRAAIVGPHGSGKSALVAALADAIEESGRRVVHFRLHDGQRHLPLPGIARPAHRGEAIALLVDGYEQLSFLSRFRLRWFCRRYRAGLVVTSHRPLAGLPTLYQVTVDLPLAIAVVVQLQTGYPLLVSSDDVARLWKGSGKDLREMLFNLFDLYQSRIVARSGQIVN